MSGLKASQSESLWLVCGKMQGNCLSTKGLNRGNYF